MWRQEGHKLRTSLRDIPKPCLEKPKGGDVAQRQGHLFSVRKALGLALMSPQSERRQYHRPPSILYRHSQVHQASQLQMS